MLLLLSLLRRVRRRDLRLAGRRLPLRRPRLLLCLLWLLLLLQLLLLRRWLSRLVGRALRRSRAIGDAKAAGALLCLNLAVAKVTKGERRRRRPHLRPLLARRRHRQRLRLLLLRLRLLRAPAGPWLCDAGGKAAGVPTILLQHWRLLPIQRWRPRNPLQEQWVHEHVRQAGVNATC